MAENISIVATLERIVYYANNWGIINVSVDKIIKGEPYDKLISCTGVMPKLNEGSQYKITAEFVTHPKYGKQYKIISIADNYIFDSSDKAEQRKFLSSIFTELQVENMYKVLEDPFLTLAKGDVTALLQVNGCGLQTCAHWVKKFNKHIGTAKIYTELSEYNLTNKMIDKLMEVYKTSEMVIDKVKTNPYTLCNDISGIGWKTADKIALEGGMQPYDSIRISGFMQYYLETNSEQGYSWVSPDVLIGALIENLGEDVPDNVISESIKILKEQGKLYVSNDKTQVGLVKYFNIENKLAEEMIRIRDAKNEFEYGEWEENVKKIEEKNGWKYTEEQYQGISSLIKNNIVLITGLAGTGKTAVVAAILAILNNKYSYAQTALSGRAAAKMSEVTGKEGFTIHRLLGYPCSLEEAKEGFAFHDENQLSLDIIIIDEVSMIDCYLFYDLLRAVKSGAKVIMLGDYGQLESIGCGNVAYDILQSPEIPTVVLHEIHRQALSSAIITESLKVRKGQQIIPKDFCGDEIRGEKKDFEIVSNLDISNTFPNAIKHFKSAIKIPNYSILDIQVLSPVKIKGDACIYNLNLAIQNIYNPCDERKPHIISMFEGKPMCIQEGDKVINTSNNYKLHTPIFNGNIGVVESIKDENIENDIGEIERVKIITVDFIGIGKVKLDEEAAHKLLLGYAITVHKFQGSSAKYVIGVIDFSSYSMLTRELVYTMITRAEEKFDLICQSGALRLATSKESVNKKQTYLQQCLHDLTHPVFDF